MTLNVVGPNTATVTLSFQEVHRESIDLLRSFEERDIKVGVAIAALAMSIGRLIGPDDMSDQQEVSFLNGLMEWAGAYFTSGEKN